MKLRYVLAPSILSLSAHAQQVTSLSAADIAERIRPAEAAARAGAAYKDAPLVQIGPYQVNMEVLTSVPKYFAVHETEAELFEVVEGSGTFTTGGTLVDPTRDGSNLNALSLKGGTARKVAKGDMVLVPENTPHKVTQVNGKLVFTTLHLPLSPNHAIPGSTGGSNMMQLSPDHAALSVADLPKMEEWYTRVIGVRDVFHFKREGFEAAHMSLGDSLHVFHIDLVWEKGSSRPGPQPNATDETAGAIRQGWVHVVFNTPMVDAAYAHLKNEGTDVQVDRNPKGLVWRMYLHDPEGNEIQIMSDQGEDRTH